MNLVKNIGIKRYIENSDDLVIQGWVFDKNGEELKYEIKINGESAESDIKKIERNDVYLEYQELNPPRECGFDIRVKSPRNKSSRIDLIVKTAEKSKIICTLQPDEIKKIKKNGTLLQAIDGVQMKESHLSVTGWAISTVGVSKIKHSVYDESGNEVEIEKRHINRKDLFKCGLIEEVDVKCGFSIEFNVAPNTTYKIITTDGKSKKTIVINSNTVAIKEKLRRYRYYAIKGARCISVKAIKQSGQYIMKNGLKGFTGFVVNKLNANTDNSYDIWFRENKVKEEELIVQRETTFAYQPKISVIVPTYKTPINYLCEMIDSVREQTYTNWELCIADGSEGDVAVENKLKEFAEKDGRIKISFLNKNLGISGNTNGALKLVTGDYVALFDHDDILAPNALFEIVKSFQEDDYDIVYTDEDKICGEDKVHIDPHFKPDFSIDEFRSHNYITHFFVVKTEIINKVGGFHSEFDGSQDYDVMFRCIEHAEKIKHIPMMLYHWRIHPNSVAGNPESKLYAYESGRKCIEAHLKRVGIEGTVRRMEEIGHYHVKYSIKENPLVSIIIENKNSGDVINMCIMSILENTTYKNLEFIIVENGNEDNKRTGLYNEIEKLDDNINIVLNEGDKSTACANNLGAEYAKGEYLLFLNARAKMIEKDSIEEMLGHCSRADVGVVGGKILSITGKVKHAGIVIGGSTFSNYVHQGIGDKDPGYVMRARINGNYSVVTSKCMFTKKQLFIDVGGFVEHESELYNEIDYCLRVREGGYSVVYNAFSKWCLTSDKGNINTMQEVLESKEVEKLRSKWKKMLEYGDPYYNRNFASDEEPFVLG